MIDAAEIKKVVDMENVLAWYGLTPNRAKGISVPFHPGQKKSPVSQNIHKGTEVGIVSVPVDIDFVMNFEEVGFQGCL